LCLGALNVKQESGMRNLTLKEIKEAFPEGKEISARLLKEVESELKEHHDQIVDIHRNSSYDEATKEVCASAIIVLGLTPLVEVKKRLDRYRAVYSDREFDNSNVITAKDVPILSLFSPEKIRKSSTRSFCCCPLHGEKSPSLCIYHKNNTFYCFGCHKGGDSIKFIQLLNGVSFPEALKYIGNLL